MLPAAFPNSTHPAERNLRVRRWDQKGKVLQAIVNTPVFQDLDAVGSTGVIRVPAAGTTLMLENGVTVSFASTGTKGFRAGDYWVFAARTADASVEKLVNAPPRGIHHHYARLGIWTIGSGDPTDCRTPWPPRGEGHDCSCTECVTPESHASGQLTIQAAVDRIRETGGTVCLAVGQYVLSEPVRLINARSVRIRGQGAASVIVTPGGAFVVNTGIAIAIEDLAILSIGNASAISVRTALGLSLQRLIIAVLGGNDARGVAIALAGLVMDATLRDNAILAPVAITATDPAAAPTPGTNVPATQMLATALLRIEDNLLWCERLGIVLAGRVFHLLSTRITGNDLIGCNQGAIVTLGLGAPGASMRIEQNSASIGGPGITAGVDGLWIENNKLTATAQGNNRTPDGAAITLRTGLDPSGSDQSQILANQINGFTGAAIAIESPVRNLIIKLNIVERCGNGIVSTDEAESGQISIENNHVTDIGAGEGQAGFVVGIAVLRAGSASVVGNTVRRVGVQAAIAPLKAGIAAFAVDRLRASGNQVMGVAPPLEFSGRGAGIVLLAPFQQAQIANNEVDRDESLSTIATKATWNALFIDQPNDNRVVARLGSYASVRIDAARALVFGAKRPFLVAFTPDATGAVAAAAASVSVLGNVLAGRSGDPAVDVSASGDCLFNDNRCDLRGKGQVAVSLAARTSIVNANRVTGGEASVLLQVNPKLFTVLGNITSNPIVSGGISSQTWQVLGQPWAPLNVVG
jgi:Right handed beta helix region